MLVIVLGALLFALAGCASDGSPTEDSISTGYLPKVPVSDSAYLREVLSPKALSPAFAPTDDGLLVAGGSPPVGEDGELERVEDVALIQVSGDVVQLPALPAGALYNLSGDSWGRSAYVVGSRCRSARIEADTGEIACAESRPAMVRLDLDALRWSEVDLPNDAPAPGGFLGDQAVYALAGDAIVYAVEPSGRAGVGSETWLSRDRGETWSRLGEPPGWLCASGGSLISAHLRSGSRLAVEVHELDLDAPGWSEAPSLEESDGVVSGSVTMDCSRSLGPYVFAVTEGTAGIAANFVPGEGWAIRRDPDGARFMELLPSTGMPLLPQIGTTDLARLDGAGEVTRVPVPEGQTPLAAIGDRVLLRDADGQITMAE